MHYALVAYTNTLLEILDWSRAYKHMDFYGCWHFEESWCFHGNDYWEIKKTGGCYAASLASWCFNGDDMVSCSLALAIILNLVLWIPIWTLSPSILSAKDLFSSHRVTFIYVGHTFWGCRLLYCIFVYWYFVLVMCVCIYVSRIRHTKYNTPINYPNDRIT